MTPTAESIITSFEDLPDSEKREVVVFILSRTFKSSLSDDELIQNAEELFLELDRKESEISGTKRKSKYSLEQLLSEINDQNVHQETDWGAPVGKEVA